LIFTIILCSMVYFLNKLLIFNTQHLAWNHIFNEDKVRLLDWRTLMSKLIR
jgi:hypothetical protein